MPFYYVELDATWFNVIRAQSLDDAVTEAKTRTGLARVSQAREAHDRDFKVVAAMRPDGWHIDKKNANGAIESHIDVLETARLAIDRLDHGKSTRLTGNAKSVVESAYLAIEEAVALLRVFNAVSTSD